MFLNLVTPACGHLARSIRKSPARTPRYRGAARFGKELYPGARGNKDSMYGVQPPVFRV